MSFPLGCFAHKQFLWKKHCMENVLQEERNLVSINLTSTMYLTGQSRVYADKFHVKGFGR